MGRKAGRVLGIASAIFIPWAAPALFSSIAGSTALATMSKTAFTLGSAATGAALGAGTAALTGGDVRRSAIMGGVGGGIGGFMKYDPATMAAPAAPITPAAPPPGPMTTPQTGSPAATEGIGTPQAGLRNIGPSIAPVRPGQLSAPPPGPMSTPAAGTPAATAGIGTPTPAQAVLQPATTAAAAAGSTSFMDALKGVPGEMVSRLKDPKALADFTLKAGQLALGHAIAGDGMPDEERRMLEEYAENLRQLQAQNMALFNERMDVARRIIQEADDFDPSVFGMQAAANQQIAAGQAMAEGTRGLTGDRLAAANRMFQIGAGRGVGQAFTQGVEAGYGVRDNMYTVGLQGMPSAMSPTDFGPIFTAYSDASTRARDQRADIGGLFQTFSQQQAREREKREREQRAFS